MPKIATDYSKTLIYKIVCKDLNIKDCYVGHTTNFRQRKSLHKSICNNQNSKYYNNYKYKFIRENGGWENWDMIEIKKYPCNDKREAEAEERRLYEELNSNLNMYRPFRTNEEKKEQIKNYYQENKDTLNDNNNNYYLENKNKILEKKNEKFNCKCGGKYTYANKAQHLKSKKHINYINNLNNNI